MRNIQSPKGEIQDSFTLGEWPDHGNTKLYFLLNYEIPPLLCSPEAQYQGCGHFPMQPGQHSVRAFSRKVNNAI